MSGLSCNACNKQFEDESEQKLHYKSEWHRYNLKRKIAGVPGVIEALFMARQTALEEERNNSSKTPMLYTCGLCDKGYRSSMAHAQHLKSRSHIMRASQGNNSQDEDNAIIKPLQKRTSNNKTSLDEDSDTEDEWEEIDPEEDLMDVNEIESDDEMGVNNNEANKFLEELNPYCCFMCDLEHDNIESCMVHLHKYHGFFIPDVEYLKDPKGLLTYLSLKVKRDFMCLYCTDRCNAFNSLEAVRKHMEAKSHCRVHYGDGSEDEEAELEEFYDYSSSFVDEDGKQLVLLDDMMNNSVNFGSSGSELNISTRTNIGKSTKTFGSREYLRYYRQKPPPSASNNAAITAALTSRYRSMGLATMQSKQHTVNMKVMKKMNKSGVENMRSKLAMKSNVIRNLPNNVPY